MVCSVRAVGPGVGCGEIYATYHLAEERGVRLVVGGVVGREELVGWERRGDDGGGEVEPLEEGAGEFRAGDLEVFGGASELESEEVGRHAEVADSVFFTYSTDSVGHTFGVAD